MATMPDFDLQTLQAKLMALGQQRAGEMDPSNPGILNGGPIPDTFADRLGAVADPNIPMQRPAMAMPDPGAIPANATSTVGMAMPPFGSLSPPDTPIPPTSLIGRLKSTASGIGDFVGNNSNTLMQLGAGLAGAPSWGTGISRGLAGATAGRQLDLAQANRGETYRALVAHGVSPQEALAAANDPEIKKAMIAKYFETKPRVPHNIGTDALGNPIMGSFDPNTGKFYDAANRMIGGGAGAGTGLPDAGAGLLAKGVEQFNPQLHGEEYFNQFSPEVQSAIKGYMRGDTQPTGNPRLKGFDTKVKEWARKYGDDIGEPISDALFSEKRKYRTELGSTSASSAGGQVKAFNQGIEHADGLATKLEKLGNYDPLGMPDVAHGVNALRQRFSSKTKGLADEAAALGQTLAGEVGKLFSGSAGGGVHERDLTRQRFNTVSSPDELAGALAGTIETMEGGLRALEQRRDRILGPNSGEEFVTKETREKIDRIKGVIARLRGEEGAPAGAPAAPSIQSTPKPGNYIYVNGRLVPTQ
jgi:hypothetical protein